MRNPTVAIVVVLLGVAAGCGGDDGAANGGGEPAAPVTEADGASSSTTPGPSTAPTPVPTPVPPAPPTVDDLLAADTPLNLAHAGGDQDAPHSTMYAFAEAVAAGADMLEIDVQLSGDGVLIVQHDDTVDKTTNETGPVADRTLAELQALDNAYWFSPNCWPCRDRPLEEYVYRGIRTGERPAPEGYTADDFRIVTFRELAERFPAIPFDIEMKGEAPEALPVAGALAIELAATGRVASSVVVSFDDALLSAFEDLAPEVETSPGVNEMTQWLLAGESLVGHRIVQVPPAFNGLPVITAEFWDKVGEAGVEVWVWPDDAATQENEAFYRELIAQGADGVIAGRPAAMTAARS
jgi:glycerophosphoryl diester phosphodiesterase